MYSRPDVTASCYTIPRHTTPIEPLPPPLAHTRTFSLPAGGATALIACTMSQLPRWHGYSYLVTVGVGSCAMLLVAVVVNNLDPRRRWPTYWW